MKNYDQIPTLKNIYLEDSHIIDVVEKVNELVFIVDFVILETHKEYSEPKKGEQYCYLRGSIKFKNCKFKWNEKNMNSVPGINKEEDFGNIDSYRFDSQKHYLIGEWGNISIETSFLPCIVFQHSPSD